jgi:hypothetical protein
MSMIEWSYVGFTNHEPASSLVLKKSRSMRTTFEAPLSLWF